MPLTHERTFRVRHYECDAYSWVKRVSYLNYMQEAAFDASAAAGYDHARYDELDCFWLVRETDIEFFRRLQYEDHVRVKTWVADFRRVRSRRAYELYQVGSEALMARAHTDWVFLDSTAIRPVSIPPDMMDAFYPEGPPEQAPPRARFPDPPPPPVGALRLQRPVEVRDIDPAQHVNNAVYMDYLEDSEERLLAACGWPRARMRAEGLDRVAHRCRIEYRQPALLGDELALVTWISDVEPTSAVLHQTISRMRDGELLVRARLQWGLVGVETERPISLTDGFVSDLSPCTAVA